MGTTNENLTVTLKVEELDLLFELVTDKLNVQAGCKDCRGDDSYYLVESLRLKLLKEKYRNT